MPHRRWARTTSPSTTGHGGSTAEWAQVASALLLGVVRCAQPAGPVRPVAAVYRAALGCGAPCDGGERLAAALLQVVGQAQALGVVLAAARRTSTRGWLSWVSPLHMDKPPAGSLRAVGVGAVDMKKPGTAGRSGRRCRAGWSDGVVDQVGQPLRGLGRGGGGDVGVGVGGDRDGGVTQAAADLQQALPSRQADGGGGVP